MNTEVQKFILPEHIVKMLTAFKNALDVADKSVDAEFKRIESLNLPYMQSRREINDYLIDLDEAKALLVKAGGKLCGYMDNLSRFYIYGNGVN